MLDLDADGVADLAFQVEVDVEEPISIMDKLPESPPEMLNGLGTLMINIGGQWRYSRFISANACT